MKTSIYLVVFCIMTLSTFLVWSKFEATNNHDISIAVSDDNDTYKFTAFYDENTTRKVQDYINQSIRPNGLFKSTHDYFNITTTLADTTEFHVKESPGRLKIELDKRKNSIASYQRIKGMCDGIGKLLIAK